MGVLLIVAAVVAYFLDRFGVPFGTQAVKVSVKRDSLSVVHCGVSIDLKYGRIEDVTLVGKGTAIVLPMNELFDRSCLLDEKSSCGAFIRKHFPSSVDTIHASIRAALASVGPYQIGTAIYLENVDSSQRNLILVATSTKREGEGVLSKGWHVMKGMDFIRRIINDHNIQSIAMPLIGSGKACLTERESFAAIMLALGELLGRQEGRRLQKVQIYAYRKDEKSPPVLRVKQARRIAALTLSLKGAA